MFNGILDEPSKTENERQNNIRKATKVMHEDKNPCIKEHDQSLKCLSKNNYKREACVGYFENYKRCRDFWDDIRVSRRKAGVRPNLPPVEEREQIKHEFFHKKMNAGTH